jgi:hypothetical protein
MGGGDIAVINVVTLAVTIGGASVACTTAVGVEPLAGVESPDPLETVGMAVGTAVASSDELPQATATSMTRAANAKTMIGRLWDLDFFICWVLLA